jgi:hypothetical protein
MGLLQYVAKMFRNKFFDTSKKYQSNFERYNKTEILIKEFKQEDQKKKIQQKESKMDDSILDNIKK